PEIVLPALDHFNQIEVGVDHPYGLRATFNPTFPDEKSNGHGWISPWHFGINEGPIVLMIENYRADFIWRLLRSCPYIVEGLRRAGFSGGWLYRIQGSAANGRNYGSHGWRIQRQPVEKTVGFTTVGRCTSGNDPRPKKICQANESKTGRRNNAQPNSINAGDWTADNTRRIQSRETKRARNNSPE